MVEKFVKPHDKKMFAILNHVLLTVKLELGQIGPLALLHAEEGNQLEPDLSLKPPQMVGLHAPPQPRLLPVMFLHAPSIA